MPRYFASAVLMCFVIGMSTAVSTQQTQKGTAPTINQAKFAGLYKTGKAIQAATKVGVNKIRFGQLLQEFATELEIAKDVVKTPREKEVFSQYETAGASYAYSADCCWTVDDGQLGELFSKLLTACSHEMENAHRLMRGLKPLPKIEDVSK